MIRSFRFTRAFCFIIKIIFPTFTPTLLERASSLILLNWPIEKFKIPSTRLDGTITHRFKMGDVASVKMLWSNLIFFLRNMSARASENLESLQNNPMSSNLNNAISLSSWTVLNGAEGSAGSFNLIVSMLSDFKTARERKKGNTSSYRNYCSHTDSSFLKENLSLSTDYQLWLWLSL